MQRGHSHLPLRKAAADRCSRGIADLQRQHCTVSEPGIVTLVHDLACVAATAILAPNGVLAYHDLSQPCVSPLQRLEPRVVSRLPARCAWRLGIKAPETTGQEQGHGQDRGRDQRQTHRPPPEAPSLARARQADRAGEPRLRNGLLHASQGTGVRNAATQPTTTATTRTTQPRGVGRSKTATPPACGSLALTPEVSPSLTPRPTLKRQACPCAGDPCAATRPTARVNAPATPRRPGSAGTAPKCSGRAAAAPPAGAPPPPRFARAPP